MAGHTVILAQNPASEKQKDTGCLKYWRSLQSKTYLVIFLLNTAGAGSVQLGGLQQILVLFGMSLQSSSIRL